MPLAGGGIALLGGLGATDLSLNEALIVRRGSSHALGHLPRALHDAPGARIGGRIFVFGGGDGIRQLAAITGVEIATGRTYPAGALPAASSDSAAATIGRTAYVVGGYTGTRWLDTIVAWSPGHRGRIVAHLPSPVRYAAVTAAHGVVVIAGGSLPDGTASRLISTYDPRTSRVRTIGRLPVATTHAAAASIGNVAYVIGGRGAATNSPLAQILAIDPSTGRVRSAGRLAVAASDLAAVSDGSAILVAGGRARHRHPNAGLVAEARRAPRHVGGDPHTGIGIRPNGRRDADRRGQVRASARVRAEQRARTPST